MAGHTRCDDEMRNRMDQAFVDSMHAVEPRIDREVAEPDRVSYMRGKFYIWAGGCARELCEHAKTDADGRKSCDKHDYIWIARTKMPMPIFDSLVVMRYAEMVQEGRVEETERRTAERYSGNFGAWALQRKLGRDPEQELKDWLDKIPKVKTNGVD